jgi:uncharacterized membrane protein
MSEPGAAPAPQRWDTGRVEAFSDGVFAIAITLLVLEIHVDDADYAHLWRALGNEWPAYLAYVTSFLTVGSVWIAHHNLFTELKYVDPWLLRINLFLLMVAAFLPFPTGVLAEAIHHSDEAERAAVSFYGATALVIELLLRSAFRYAEARPELAHAPAGPSTAEHHGGWGEKAGTVLYALGILAGILIFPKLAIAAYLVVAVRGVVVIGGEGRLGMRGLRKPR